MPSANPKLEKQASTEATEPIRQAITVIEHKIRNLEKRKLKLESYKDLQKNGKELNHDQKVAVEKYDEVLQTLDITKDLCKQIVGISNDSARQQKKLARKEALERMQQEVAKVREVLLIQDILLNIGGDAVREDFLAGTNGASKLTPEELKYLEDIFNELTMKRQTEVGEPTFAQQLQKSAEHYVAIIEGKQREVVGTTYVKIKEIITSIHQCGYFDQNQAQEPDVNVEAVNETSAESQVVDEPVSEQPLSEEFNADEVHIPPADSIIPIANYPVPVASVPVVSSTVGGPLPVVAPQVAIPSHPNTNVDQSYYANATGYVAQQPPLPQNQQPQPAPRINDVIGTPNFCFLQESEVDSPDVAGQRTPLQVPHIPTAVNAPIPTQTFTNQNFAGAPVPVGQQVIYQHPPQEIQHIPGFTNPNPPPPIPMPPSHQQQNLQYSPQNPTTYQQQQQSPTQPQQQQPPSTQKQQPTNQPRSHQQQSNFESHQNLDAQQNSLEEKGDKTIDDSAKCGADIVQTNESVDWCQMSENPVDEWAQSDNQQQSGQDQHSQQQSSWGEQRTYRGRGGRRGNSNSYNGRSRGGGSGGYQQNGRGGGQGNYYRNETNYQNGYQQRNFSNDGNSNYNGNFKRGSGGTRSGPRGSGDRGDRGDRSDRSDRSDRVGMDRGGRNGQFRGQRGGGSRGGYTPRGKPQTQQ